MSNHNDTGGRRLTREQAMAYHPSSWAPRPHLRVVAPLTEVFTPQDAVDTAQAFHAELGNAQRGRPDKPRWSGKLFGRSRFRRARIYDGLAVTLLMTLMACLGVVVFAASAKADNSDGYDPVAYAYATAYSTAVCGTLAGGHASTDGLIGIMRAMMKDGLAPAQAGEAVGISIHRTCPRYRYLIDLFVAEYGSPKAVVA